MAWFRRRRRPGVGTFVAPDPPREATEAELVEEGTMIARYAVRMSVKNEIIVRAVGERADYDQERFRGVAREEFGQLAAENRASAERIGGLRRHASGLYGRPRHQHDYQSRDDGSLARRQAVSTTLADTLEALAADDAVLDTIIDEARAAAWGEVGATITARLPDRTREAPSGFEHELDVSRAIAQDLAALSRVMSARRARQGDDRTR